MHKHGIVYSPYSPRVFERYRAYYVSDDLMTPLCPEAEQRSARHLGQRGVISRGETTEGLVVGFVVD